MEDETPERKTLYQQLEENKDLKEKEFQDLVDKQKSSYKLSEESLNYYNGLKQKDHDKELIIQKEEEIELTRYRELKSKKKVLEKEISATAGVKVGPFVRKKQSNPAEITKKRKVDGNYGGVLKETADADFGGVNPDRTTVISSGNTFTDSQNSILKLTSSKPNTKGIDYKSHPKESISQQTPLVSGYSSSDESSS